MVNVNKVSMVKREGNNMKLQIEGLDNIFIPVSRGYAPVVKNFFETATN
jgi:DNA-binding LytR/AlgR family response regulator